MSRPWLQLVLFACLSCIMHGAVAQDAATTEDGPTLYGVELEPKADFPDGKAQYLEARASAIGQQYKVDGTDLDQPILVSVLTRDVFNGAQHALQLPEHLRGLQTVEVEMDEVSGTAVIEDAIDTMDNEV